MFTCFASSCTAAVIVLSVDLVLHCHLQDRIGGAGTSPTVVNCIIFALFVVNAVTYICLTHLVYIPLLRGMGYRPTSLPKFVQKLVAQRQGQFELS